jgi:zinc protease
MNRKLNLVLALAILMTGFSSREAAVSEANRMNDVMLSSGVTVSLKENRYNEIVAFRVYLECGPRYEAPEETGLSNLMLRLLLSGTENRSARQVAGEIDALGAELNTDVNKDYGSLILKSTRAAFEQALDILLDCLLKPTFPQDRFENEKETILKEIRQEKDSLLTEAFRSFQKEIYGRHPYGQPALGLEETVSRFTRDDVVQMYRRSLDPERTRIVVVGNFDEEALLEILESRIGLIADRPARGQLALDGLLVPFPKAPTEISMERKSETEWLVLGYLGPPISSEDYAAMKVIDSIMGGSMDSRLFTELRDKQGLAYQVGSTYPSRLGPSIFAIYIGAAPENHDQVVKGILRQVERIQNEPLPPDELQRAKTYIKGTFVMGLETNMGQASTAGLFGVLGMGTDFIEQYPEKIEAVTAEKVREVSRKYLNIYTLSTVRPEAAAAVVGSE